MRWEGRRESENVNDRRGMSPAMVGGGGLITGDRLDHALVFGVNPQQFLQQVAQQQGGGAAVAPQERSPEEDRAASFVKVVLADTEDVWNDLFPKLWASRIKNRNWTCSQVRRIQHVDELRRRLALSIVQAITKFISILYFH